MEEMDVEEAELEIPLATQHAFLDQAKQYNFVAVKEMLEATPGLVNVQPSGRWSALHQAAEAGDEAAVSYLLEKGADRTLKTKDGKVPLQVTKNAAVRALLGGGEKRSADEGGYKAAKAPAVLAEEVSLKVNYVSGEELASLKWPANGTVEELQDELGKHLEPGKVVKSLLKENYTLPAGTLQNAGLEKEAVLSAVIEAEPTLYLFKPCTAAELCARYEDWSAGEDESLIVSERPHQPMEKAPEEARSVAQLLKDAMPGLDSMQICRSSEGDSPGEVVAISGGGEEPRKACLKALRVVKESGTFGDKACADDPECKGMWSIATIEHCDWKDYLGKGFNACPEDTVEDMLENGIEQEELDQFVAGTKIMNEKLQKHFIFGFDDGAVVAPFIYGGYTPQGHIVAVLSYRVWT